MKPNRAEMKAPGAREASKLLAAAVRGTTQPGEIAEPLARLLGSPLDPVALGLVLDGLSSATAAFDWSAIDDVWFEATLEAAVELGRGDLVARGLADAALPRGRAKLLKRAAHTLRSRGVEVPEPAAPPRHATLASAESRADESERYTLMSPPDGSGARLRVVIAMHAEGAVFVEAIFRDDTLVRVAGALMPRKKVRQLRDELEATWRNELQRVDAGVGAAEVLTAFAEGRLESSSLREWQAEMRSLLGPLAAGAKPLPEPDLAPDALRRRAGESGRLLELSELAGWIPDRASLLDCQEKLRVAGSSDLVLNEVQRREQLDEAFHRAARDYARGATRTSLASRFRHLSRFLLASGRADDAERAWAAAVELAGEGVPAAVEQMFRRLFGDAAGASVAPTASAPAKSGLILPGAGEPGPPRGGLILP